MGQPLEGLKRANEVRYARCQIKRAIKSGKSVPFVLDDPDVQGMRLWDLLLAQWYWGPRRVARFMRASGIGQHRIVGDMTPRQREALRSLDNV